MKNLGYLAMAVAAIALLSLPVGFIAGLFVSPSCTIMYAIFFFGVVVSISGPQRKVWISVAGISFLSLLHFYDKWVRVQVREVVKDVPYEFWITHNLKKPNYHDLWWEHVPTFIGYSLVAICIGLFVLWVRRPRN